MTEYYRGTHRSQYDGSRFASENCTPTSGANGARVATLGQVDKSGGSIRALVARSEEQNPTTPGWSLRDLDLAMSRLGVPFSIGSGGWDGVRAARAATKGVVLQGDSDRFGNNTCSGAFDGDHAIYIHPDTISTGLWLIADPICKIRRWESESILKAYATKFNPNVSFGTFAPIVSSSEGNDMAVLPVSDTEAKLFDVAAGAVVYDLDGTTRLATLSSGFTGRYSPFGMGNRRAMYVTVNAVRRLGLVSGTNVRAVPATGYTQVQMDAATSEARAEGVGMERTRLRSVLGL